MKQCKKALRLGSDCSGMGTDIIAAKQLGLKHKVVFVSDKNKNCRAVLNLSHTSAYFKTLSIPFSQSHLDETKKRLLNSCSIINLI